MISASPLSYVKIQANAFVPYRKPNDDRWWRLVSPLRYLTTDIIYIRVESKYPIESNSWKKGVGEVLNDNLSAMGGLLSGLSQSFQDPLIGKPVYIDGHRYIYRRRLGAGGFGAVYEATTSNGSRVAIKIVDINRVPPHRKGVFTTTYLNEVQLLEKLRQETKHVVHIIDFDFSARSGQAYIVMELGNENLSKLIDRLRNYGSRAGGIDETMIRAFWRQMISIVRTLHRHNIIHMDLKPDNFILFGSTLKIADLGVSRRADVLGYARMGTPLFSAPELMLDTPGNRRFYGPKADIWSLGAILYFMVYGIPPRYSRHASRPPPGRPPYPDPYINDILRRTLVMDPNARADIYTLLAHPFTRS